MEKQTPYSRDAEMSVLGSVFVDQGAMKSIIDKLEDIESEEDECIHGAIKESEDKLNNKPTWTTFVSPSNKQSSCPFKGRIRGRVKRENHNQQINKTEMADRNPINTERNFILNSDPHSPVSPS